MKLPELEPKRQMETATTVRRRAPLPSSALPEDLARLHSGNRQLSTTGKESSLPKIQRKPSGRSPLPGSVVQAKFVSKNKVLELEDISVWYSEFIQTMGENVPRKYQPILKILIDAGETIDMSLFDDAKDPPEAFCNYLKKRDADYRPTVGKYPIKGKLSIKKPGSLEQWELGKAKSHEVPKNLQSDQETELAHVTYKASNLELTQVDPDHGSNPGEFGSGFYLTTGHEKQPQEEVSKKWGDEKTGKFPKEIVRFKIASTTLSKIVDDDPTHLAFLVHVLQASSGYPKNMSDSTAISIMNQINLKGKVLIFPDDEEQKISIDPKTKKTWTEYTEFNSGPSGHFLVIGPQRPKELKGIRQIAVRGQYGAMFINIAQRSQQKMQ